MLMCMFNMVDTSHGIYCTTVSVLDGALGVCTQDVRSLCPHATCPNPHPPWAKRAYQEEIEIHPVPYGDGLINNNNNNNNNNILMYRYPLQVGVCVFHLIHT